MSLCRLLPQPFGARRLDLADLLVDEAPPDQIAPQLGQCVGRQRYALRRAQVLKPRMPSRAGALFTRLPMRVRSPTRLSRSRLGRWASSSSRLGTATMLQGPRSPRS